MAAYNGSRSRRPDSRTGANGDRESLLETTWIPVFMSWKIDFNEYRGRNYSSPGTICKPYRGDKSSRKRL